MSELRMCIIFSGNHFSCFSHFLSLFTKADTWIDVSAARAKLLSSLKGISLGREDLLEKRMATYSSILAWRIPWTEDPGGPQSMGSQRVEHDWVTNTFTFTRRHLIKPTTPSPRLGNFSVWLMVHTPPFSLHILLSRCLCKWNSENCLKLFRAP